LERDNDYNEFVGDCDEFWRECLLSIGQPGKLTLAYFGVGFDVAGAVVAPATSELK
jgi:hypothetical protein